MRWGSADNELTEEEKHTVEDLLPVMIKIVNDEIKRFQFGYEYKSLLQSKAFAAAIEAVMQWKAAERMGDPFSVTISQYAAESIKATVIESIVKLYDSYEKAKTPKQVNLDTPHRPRPNTDKPGGRNR